MGRSLGIKTRKKNPTEVKAFAHRHFSGKKKRTMTKEDQGTLSANLKQRQWEKAALGRSQAKKGKNQAGGKFTGGNL